MRIALYQPDIPQNAGAILRLGACLNVDIDVVEPAGFVWSDARMRRAGMDYLDLASLTRHPTWDAFRFAAPGRVVLATTKAAQNYIDFRFEANDTLLFGSESAGVPDAVHRAVDARVVIPMRPGARSINVAQSAAMILGEAFRQVDGFSTANLDAPSPIDSGIRT